LAIYSWLKMKDLMTPNFKQHVGLPGLRL